MDEYNSDYMYEFDYAESGISCTDLREDGQEILDKILDGRIKDETYLSRAVEIEEITTAEYDYLLEQLMIALPIHQRMADVMQNAIYLLRVKKNACIVAVREEDYETLKNQLGSNVKVDKLTQEEYNRLIALQGSVAA